VPGFTPEFALLLDCCAGDYLPEDKRISRLRKHFSQTLDWRRVVALAEHHCVIPQVYQTLNAVEDVFLSNASELRAAVSASFKSNIPKTLWFSNELSRVYKGLCDRGIRVLAYKGPLLAQILYGDVAQRQFSDLDFVVPPSDVTAAKAVLLDLGYRLSLNLTERQEREYLKSGYEYAFDHTMGKNLLELHWHTQPRFYAIDFDIEGTFERAVEANINGMRVRTLNPDDLLLVLCAHGAKHLWVRLSMLCDVAQLARGQDIDWAEIERRAMRLGITRIVAVTFMLVHELLGTPLPPLVRADRAAEVATQHIMDHLAGETECDSESLAYFRFSIALRERWQDQVRFASRLFSTPSVGEWEAVNLPGPLFPLYRLVRAGRLARRAVGL
jgi:hypothetical protein